MLKPNILRRVTVLLALGIAAPSGAQVMPHVVGDVGMAVYKTPPVARTTDRSTAFLPYVYADIGQFYARVDTVGYKLLPMGTGHLEMSARVSFEGYQSDNPGIGKRARPKPIGLGTFQETPLGAFILYGFRDPVSAGSLIDATYAAEVKLGHLHAYPQVGMERRDRKYVDSLYGINASDALRSGLSPYSPGYSLAPNAALALEYPLANDLKMTFQVRKKWLDKSIYESPLVDIKQQTLTFLAISHTFK